eukprot:69320_1
MDLCSASQEVKTKDDKEGGDIDLSIGMSQLNLTDPGLKARHADLEIKTVKTHDSVLKKKHEVDSALSGLSPNACRIYNLLKGNLDGMLVSEVVRKLNLVKKNVNRLLHRELKEAKGLVLCCGKGTKTWRIV